MASAADAPFTVLVLEIGDEGLGQCTGSVLDERRVLTAAHCVVGADGQPLSADRFLVIAGTAQLLSEEPPPEAQFADVAAIRRHPAFVHDGPSPFADVAVLELATPLTFTSAVAPIPLVALGAPPAAGAAVVGFGWGLSAPGADDGRMHLLDMTVDPSACWPGLAGVGCASSPAGSICFGDSGGPIVAAGQLVGVASTGTGGGGCAPGVVAGFVDLASPGIGLWVRGDEAPPSLPKATEPPALSAPPLGGGAADCRPPAWSGTEAVTTVFSHADTGTVVQEGPSTTYAPGPSDAGHDLTCTSVGRSPGGSAAMPAQSVVSVLASKLSLALGRRRLAVSYVGAPRLALTATATRRGREVWSRSVRSSGARLPNVRPGRYRVCVAAPAAGQFAGARACERWRVRRR